LAFSPDGQRVVIAGEDSTARIWDVATRTPVAPPLHHQAWIFAVAFSPDGKSVLTGSRDRTARLWDAATGMPIAPPLVHPGQVLAVAFRPDGRAIVTGCTDGKARLYPIAHELPDDLDRIDAWLGVRTGLTLDDRGSVEILDNANWHARRQQLNSLGGPPDEDLRR
jgi:WD40 repeat protein